MVVKNSRIAVSVLLLTALTAGGAHAQQAAQKARPTVDVSKVDTLYLVGYSHLDTQWRWSYPQVIRDFIPDTLHNNFRLFELYPDYVFNFSGSRRYEMMKEYYPADYEKLKTYIKSGQWFPCGSSVDEGDANVPSAESLVRHTLYGNHYFQREFGVTSHEFMLPDCFGFPYALPTVLSHCGIEGFSTQKLTWGSAVGIPFKVGSWEGPDGSRILAAFDPGSYNAGFKEDLSQNTSWLARVQKTRKASGAGVDYHYYGVGDRGGSPDENSVKWMEKSIVGTGPLHVVSSNAEEMFRAITPGQAAKMPRYKGELLLTEHSSGSLSSQAYMKRWNRKNELLADAAERASVAAMWLGDAKYPSDRLYQAWDLFLGSQMHDMLPGTSLPKAYEYCWNDELLALNQFAAVTKDSVGAVSAELDTHVQGVPLVVYNPLSIGREDVVEATVDTGVPGVQVYGPDGQPVPTQVVGNEGTALKIIFLAKAPSTGYTVYDARPSGTPKAHSMLRAIDHTLENEQYKVTLNDAGDISSIYDKKNSREALKSPIRLAFQYHNPSQFPAWNMDWDDAKAAPRGYVDGPAKIRIVESGPVRVTLEVERESRGSKFVQQIRLASGGAGDRIEVANKIDWRTQEVALKASFPMSSGNPKATYDLQVGTIQRGNNDPKKYEVPQHQWFDLTGTDGRYGVAILNDSKFASDKPNDNTVQLTMIYTPGVRGGYQDQATQDIGKHDILYAVAPHAGDWRSGDVPWRAKRLNQPLIAFEAAPHAGALGKTFSLVSLNTHQVQIEAVKKAEDSNEIIVRLRELEGKEAKNVQIQFAGRILSAREVNGQEAPLGAATITNGKLTTTVKGYGLRAFAVTLAAPAAKVDPVVSKPLPLTYDLDAVSFNSGSPDGAFDQEGRSYPGEQLPKTIDNGGVTFQLGPTGAGAKNALVAHGQTIDIPAGSDRVYVLASATQDASANFVVGGQSIPTTVGEWTGYVGQWDNRQWGGVVPELTYGWNNPYVGLTPGYVKTSEVAWYSSHRHSAKGANDLYQYSYLFKYSFPVANGAKTITLPDDARIRVFAVTAARNAGDAVRPTRPLYDTLADHQSTDSPEISPSSGSFHDAMQVSIAPPFYWNDKGLRYTLDGSKPSLNSPVYSGPLTLNKAVTLTAAEVQPDGAVGPTTVARLDIQDTTPPTVVSSEALQGLAKANIRFSEIVTKESAEDVNHYKLTGAVQVQSAKLNPTSDGVELTLTAPLPQDVATSLALSGVRDTSPSGNAVTDQALPLKPGGIAFTSPALTAGATQEFKPADLPIQGSAPWTMNLFVKTDKQPENRTNIAGFGNQNDGKSGTGRYIAKFANGIHFWSADHDVESTVPLDLGAWQMITAAYDGATLRLYKNGVQIGSDDIKLSDDVSEVHIFPKDAWEHERVFAGDVRDFTIWKYALSPDSVQTLWQNGKGK
jgi:alpha-mannosidase